MEIEVRIPRRGELWASDLREVAPAAHVRVLVLDADGAAPIVGMVEFATLRAGRGDHVAVLCPRCRKAKRMLLARQGELACQRCHRTLTAHQAERKRSDWTTLGGREHDRILRLLTGRGRSNTKVGRARCEIDALVRADYARVEHLRERLEEIVKELQR